MTIIGEPNVGKSTLMNVLLGQKISIVTEKPQTTRHKILGILSGEQHQIVFLDTPGIIKPRYLLQEAMMQFAGSAIADADILLFMIDAANPMTGGDQTHAEAFSRLQGLKKPVFPDHQQDRPGPQRPAPAGHRFLLQGVSLPGGVPGVRTAGGGAGGPGACTRFRCFPNIRPTIPPDIVSEQSERFFVAEIIREKIFLATKEEIPYATTVDVVEFKEREAGKWFISADMYVERDSQKGILIGKKGSMLKEIGRASRTDIETLLNHPVFLELHVKVREKWREKEEWLKRLGYGRG